jgi:T4-like virus Myoviridae tail sheath stabiliser
MGFEMTGLFYDSKRKLPSLSKIGVKDPTDANKLKYIYAPVPYNFTFTLWIYVKYAEDGTKIVEQILPFFTPDWTLSIELVPEMCITHDIPITLDNIHCNDNFEGDFKTRRVIIWQLDFTLKGYIYGPVKKKPIIKFTNTNLFGSGNTDPLTIKVQPGMNVNLEPTTVLGETVPKEQIFIDSDYGFIVTNNLNE